MNGQTKGNCFVASVVKKQVFIHYYSLTVACVLHNPNKQAKRANINLKYIGIFSKKTFSSSDNHGWCIA